MEENTGAVFSDKTEQSCKNSEKSLGFDEAAKLVPTTKKKGLKKKQKTEDCTDPVTSTGAESSNEESANVDDNNNGVSISVLSGEELKINENCRRWNLASFLFPDNNLPQSWLDIMEENKNMSPFDDLCIPENSPKADIVDPVTSTDSTVTAETEENEILSIPDCPPESPDSVIFCGKFTAGGGGSKEECEVKEDITDPDLAAMPELTLSVPGKDFEDEMKDDEDIEMSADAPTIQPYDSEIIENCNELPKLVKEIKSDKEDEVQETSPEEVAIQIRIIETRHTRKLGVPTPESTQAKSLKRKYGSYIHQQNHILNYRIKNQISTMQRETKKKYPDVELLRRNMCLEETFKYRLDKFMKDNEHSIEDLLKEFPALKIVSIIMDEFERVVEVTNPMVRSNPITFLEKALKKRCQRVLSKFRQMPTDDQLPIITTALEKLEQEPQNENLKKIVSSLCMIVSFSEDKCLSSVISFKKEKEAFNYQSIGLPKMIMREKSLLLEQAEIPVYLEGQEIFKVANIYEGMLAIFAISHVFNLDYEAKIEPLMRYFEYLVDIPQVLFQEEDPLPSDDEI